LEVEDSLNKLPGELSTGARRAVAIARSLAQNPEAILYDEPTTMVDPIMAAHMGDLIARLKEAFHKLRSSSTRHAPRQKTRGLRSFSSGR